MRILAILALAALISLHAAEPPFKQPAEFSCAMKIFEKGSEAGTGRMYQGAGGLRRMDMNVSGQQAAVIIRSDRKQMMMLMDDQKMAMTMPLDLSQQPDPSLDPSAVWNKTGSETINGVACTRYDWSSATTKGQAWVDDKRSVLIRVKDAKEGGQVDFIDYQLAPQKASLFEIPAGYKTMAMPGGQ